MDLIEIVDVEKYVSRRLSKKDDQDQKDYELSPKMNKLLGKFYNEVKNNDDTIETSEQKINVVSAENAGKRDSKKVKTLAKNNNIMKKQMMKIGANKPQPKIVRRNSVNIKNFYYI